MIVKMKKVSIVVFDRLREQSLRSLRKLGLVHIESGPAGSDELDRLNEQNGLLSRSLALLPEQPKEQKAFAISTGSVAEEDIDGCLEIAGEIVDLTEKIRLADEKIEKLEREQQQLVRWGGYNPHDIRELAEKGIAGVWLEPLLAHDYAPWRVNCAALSAYHFAILRANPTLLFQHPLTSD